MRSPEAGGGEVAGEFVWCHEPLPLMRTGRQPAQHVLRPDNRQQVGFHGAVDGRNDHQPAGPNEPRADRQKGRRIGHVLNDLEAEDGVERRAGREQRLDRGLPVVDGQPRIGRVPPRRLDILPPRIDPRNAGAHPCSRLGYEPAAAADIEHAETREAAHLPCSLFSNNCAFSPEVRRQPVANELQPGWPELMQRREFAPLVPPLRRDPAETIDLGRIERATRWAASCGGRGRAL